MFIGKPTSPYGYDVEVNVDVGTISFLRYENSTFSLSIPANVTTNAEEGIYEILVTLKDETIGSNYTTTLMLTLLPVDEDSLTYVDTDEESEESAETSNHVESTTQSIQTIDNQLRDGIARAEKEPLINKLS